MKFLIGVIALAAMGLGVLFWIDAHRAASKSARGGDLAPLIDRDESQPEPEFNVNALAEQQEKQSQFGSDRVKEGKEAKPVAFEAKRAMKYLDSICELGPRISGTASMRKQQELIKKHFEELGAKIEFQTFTAAQNSVRGKVEMTNIIISFQPEKKRRVI